MKKLLLITLLLWAVVAEAQFAPGQILTAAELNAAFANTAPAPGVTCLGTSSALNYTSNTFSCNAAINAITLGGATFSAPGPIGSVSTSSGAFSSVSTPSATIGGGSINATSVGATSPSTGAFTALSASSTVSGAGFTTLLSPYLLSATASSTYATIAQATTALAATGGSINGVTVGATTPSTVAATALSSTGTFTPSQTSGIVGTTTNNNANAGSIGEFVTATGTAVSLTSTVSANCTSISLTAGDWDVWGNVAFLPAGSTVFGNGSVGINTTSAAAPAAPFYSLLAGLTFTNGNGPTLTAPMVRESLASTTTIFLVTTSAFTVSTETATCFIAARRRR
jgi:hypothetical protein